MIESLSRRSQPASAANPLPPAVAWRQVEIWLSAPDAQLAALALEHGLTVCSADTDFARFTELRWHNPLS